MAMRLRLGRASGFGDLRIGCKSIIDVAEDGGGYSQMNCFEVFEINNRYFELMPGLLPGCWKEAQGVPTSPPMIIAPAVILSLGAPADDTELPKSLRLFIAADQASYGWSDRPSSRLSPVNQEVFTGLVRVHSRIIASRALRAIVIWVC